MLAQPQPRRTRARGDAESPSARVGRLTSREIEILQLTADGLVPQEISERLGISRHTLRTHVQNALTKLAVHSKLEAITLCIRTGTVRLEPLVEESAN